SHAGQPSAGSGHPGAGGCRRSARTRPACLLCCTGIPSGGAATCRLPCSASARGAFDLRRAALAPPGPAGLVAPARSEDPAKKKGGAIAPPFFVAATARSELEGHPRERGAAVQVVLGGEGRDVAVTRGHTVGDFGRRLV